MGNEGFKTACDAGAALLQGRGTGAPSPSGNGTSNGEGAGAGPGNNRGGVGGAAGLEGGKGPNSSPPPANPYSRRPANHGSNSDLKRL